MPCVTRNDIKCDIKLSSSRCLGRSQIIPIAVNERKHKDPGPFWRAVPGRAVGRGDALFVVAAGLFQHFAEVSVFAARGLQIEDEIFDAEAQVIEALLEAADGLAQALVALAR